MKSTAKTALPIFIVNLATFAVTFASSLLAGSLGNEAVSALYATSQVQLVLQTLVLGIESAIFVIGSRMQGASDEQGKRRVLTLSVVFSLIFGILTTLVCIFCARQIVSLFITGGSNIDTGVHYLRFISVSMPLFALSHSIGAFLKSTGKEWSSAIISLIVFLINIPTNYILIFGFGGIRPLGLYGAAITLTGTRILEFLLYIFVLIKARRNVKKSKRLPTQKNETKEKKISYISHALPLFTSQVLWGINLVLSSAILRRALSESGSPSLGIMNTVNSLSFVITGTLSSALAVTIGKYFALKKENELKSALNYLFRLFAMLGIGMSAVLFLLQPTLLSFYNLDQKALEISRCLLSVLSISLLFTPFCTGCIYGIIRGMADSKFILLCDTFTVFFFSLPLALILYRLSMPYGFIFLALKSEQLLKCPIGYLRIKKARCITRCDSNSHT